jgi:SPW repeat-containing protein
MTDVSQRRTAERAELAEHPDAMELRARYERVLGGRDVVFVDAPVFLAGLYAAISPWVVAFASGQPQLRVSNLIVGIAVAVLALGFTTAPERMYGLSWAICAAGIWLVISTWIVGDSPDGGVIVSNVVVGGVLFLLGVASAGAAMRASRGMKGAEA